MFLACMCMTVMADTLYVGDGAEYKSITEAVAAAVEGDEIVISGGVYDESRETFPIEVDKTVYIHAAKGEDVLLKSPLITITMKLESPGIRVEGLGFEFIRSSGMYILADDVVLDGCRFQLGDPEWRETACALWISGSKHVTVTNTEFIDSSLAIAGPPDTGEHRGVPVMTALFEVGEDIEYFTTHTFEQNTVNGRPMDYVIGLKDQEYTSDCGQLIAVNCENVVFTGLDVSRASIGLQLVAGTDCTVTDCRAENSGIFGIYLAKCKDCVVENIAANDGSHGIDVRDCDRCLIDHCTANDSGQGIFLSPARDCQVTNCEACNCGTGYFVLGENNLVDGCIAEGNELGLYVQKGSFTMTNSTLRSNTSAGLRSTYCAVNIRDNYFEENHVGCTILHTDEASFAGNTFTGSEYSDLYFKDCTGMEYAENVFSDGLDEPVGIEE